MKKTVFVFTGLLMSLIIQAQQPTISRTLSKARGHYQLLAAYSKEPLSGQEALDVRKFELEAPSGKVQQAELTSGGPSAVAVETKAPESKCDPEACQPEVIGNGRKRSPHYLTGREAIVLPQPPANSSDQTRAELKYLLDLQQGRTEEDVRASGFYAGVYYRTGVSPDDPDYAARRRSLFHIGRSIGNWFNADSLPLTATLAARVWKDAEYFIWKYKNHYNRIRPYKLEPALNNLEETNWAAYPSGHASNSYINAYLFSELLPEFSDFFFKDAYDMAHSREILGVHYPSDSESGRILAQQLVRQLFEKPAFRKDFAAARQEIRKRLALL